MFPRDISEKERVRRMEEIDKIRKEAEARLEARLEAEGQKLDKPSEENASKMARIIYDFARAALQGAAQGAKHGIEGLVNMVLHPIDNVIKPINTVLHDAVIISAGHVNYANTPPAYSPFMPDIEIARQAVFNNPQLYHDAMNRMQQHVNGVKQAGQRFADASWQEQVRMATKAIASVGTSIYAPGLMINSVKAMINLHNIGIPFNPPIFLNRHGDIPNPAVPHYNYADIRAMKGEHNFIFVITENGQLIMAPRVYECPSPNQPGRVNLNPACHHDLAQKTPVFSAGVGFVKDGLIVKLNNSSGHFLPNHYFIKQITEHFFKNNGYPEAVGKFQPHIVIDGMKGQEKMVPNKMNPLPPQGAAVGAGSIFAQGLKNYMEKEEQKAQQKEAAQKNLAENNLRDKALNPAAKIQPIHLIPLAQHNAFNIPYFPDMFRNHRLFHNLPNNPGYERYGFEPRVMFVGNQHPSVYDLKIMLENHIANTVGIYLTIGQGYLSGYGCFHNALAMSGLINDYNSYNIYSLVMDALRSYQIGGVSGNVAIVKGMVNSEAHAEAAEYFFCFSAEDFPFSQNLVEQIQRELANAYFTHKTLPFVSMNFNNNGCLYPVIHPAYEGTLIGEIITFLDYWMKGYLNGFVFDNTEFLKLWPKNANLDEKSLREHMTDLKEYCKKHTKNLGYISLRELMNRYGLQDKISVAGSAYTQPYMTAFRIIAYQEQIRLHGNILLLKPNFRIEYSIDMAPDYKEYIEQYYKEHGDYPADYETIRLCYELFANEIKEKMSQVPLFSDYFKLLGVINAFCYAYATFEKMGKIPVFERKTKSKESYAVPKVFPPLPVKEFHTYPVNITIEKVLNYLSRRDMAEMNGVLYTLFGQKTLGTLPENFAQKFNQPVIETVKAEIASHLKPNEVFESNETEIERISRIVERFIHGQFALSYTSMNDELANFLKRVDDKEQKRINALALPEKIIASQKALDGHVASVKKRWEGDKCDDLQEADILKEFSSDLHDALRKIFKDQDDEITQERRCLVYLCKKACGILSCFERKYPPIISTELQLVFKDIEAEVKKIEQHFSRSANKADEIAKAKKSYADTIIEGFQNASAKTRKSLRKRQAVYQLEHVHKQTTDRLKRFTDRVNYFSKYLLEKPAIANHALATKYTHTRFTFSDSDFDSGENFRIIGGCGMELPNLESKPIEHAEEFSLALANAITKESGKPAQFTFNHQEYVALRLPVQDIRKIADVKSAPKMPAQNAFLGVMSGEVEVDSLTNSLVSVSMDPANANMIHYAAAMLAPKYFNKIQAYVSNPLEMRDKLGNTPLHFAAREGNFEVISILLNTNPDMVDIQNNQGVTPLILAIQGGHLEAVKALIVYAANANYHLPNDLFPLYIAIQNNFDAIALWLIDNVPMLAINEELNSKMTALHLAIDARLQSVALKLVEKGANCSVKRKADGFSPMHAAVQQGNIELLKMMVKKGVSLNTLLESGKNALHIAAETGQSECLHYLIDQRVDVNSKTGDGETALMLAIKSGQLEAAKVLSAKTQMDQTNKKGQTTSLLALQYGMPVISDMLIVRGENPDLRDKKDYNYSYYLVRNGEHQRFSALLHQKKINLSQKYQGDNLLEVAAKFGHFLIVYKLLREKVIDFKQKPNGFSLLEYAVMADEIGYFRRSQDSEYSKSVSVEKTWPVLAAKNGSYQCLKLSLTQLTRIEIQGLPLLQASLESNDLKTLELVLQYTQAINDSLDESNNTALHLAVAAGSQDAVELLMRRGSNVCLRNSQNQTPFHIALMQSDNSLLKRLFKLTKPAEWPRDLWGITTVKLSASMRKTLAIYHKRLPLLKQGEVAPVAAALTELPTIMLSELLQQRLNTLQNHFANRKFDEAAESLEYDWRLLKLFNSQQGASLLLLLFSNIDDYSSLLTIFQNSKKEKKVSELMAARLLAVLKAVDINPARYTGKNNVLIAMIKADTDEEACYRLEVFTKYFPESLIQLTMDYLPGKERVAAAALRLNKTKLFSALVKLTRENKPNASPSFYGLHEAVLSNRYDVVVDMLNYYPVDDLNEKKQTPLMLAATLDNARIIELLLERGANPDKVDIQGQNALHHALLNKAEFAALTILPMLAHKNQSDRRGMSPLMLAASKGILPVVRYLCEQGDYSNSFDKTGWNALHYAALNGQAVIIEYLVSQDFNVDVAASPANTKKIKKDTKSTPIHLAALKGHVEAVQKLNDLKANLLQEDNNKNTVCEYAVIGKNREMLQLVQTFPLYQTRLTTLLHVAAETDNDEVVSQLILQDVNLNATDQAGSTALHKAARNNALKVANLLLKGGDVGLDMIDQNACTPLQYAAYFGHISIIELLCESGADINYKNSNRPTALFIACEQGHAGAVASLLKYAADFSITNEEGFTPAQIALANGHVNIDKKVMVADYLVQNGIFRIKKLSSSPMPDIRIASTSFTAGK